jgi:hypothetical protein
MGFRYRSRIIGVLYAELDGINAQNAERRAREHGSDGQAYEAAKQARAQADESRSTVEAVEQQSLHDLPSKELKSLYREVAKRVHPTSALTRRTEKSGSG